MSRNEFVPSPLPGLSSSRPPPANNNASFSSSRQNRQQSFQALSSNNSHAQLSQQQLHHPPHFNFHPQHQQHHQPRATTDNPTGVASGGSRPVPTPAQRRGHWQIVMHHDTSGEGATAGAGAGAGAGGAYSSSSSGTRPGSTPSSPASFPSSLSNPASPAFRTHHGPAGQAMPPPLFPVQGHTPNNHTSNKNNPPTATAAAVKPPKLHRCPHPTCDVSFAQKSHANSHYKAVHENLKPFKCEDCSLAFNKRFDLNSHRAAVHDKNRDHRCPKCAAAFAKKSNLTRHMSSIHGGSGGSRPAGSNVGTDSGRYHSGDVHGYSGSRNLSFVIGSMSL